LRRSSRAATLFIGAIFVAVIVTVAVAAVWFQHAVRTERSYPAKMTQLVIPKGSTFSEITAQLQNAAVIGDPLAFRILARIRHAEADVRAGEYRFGPHQNESEILQQLQSGGAQIAVWVVIPEGFTSREIAQRLQDAGIGTRDEFERVFRGDSLLVAGARTKNLEGYLFPSTYLVPTDASPRAVARIMTVEFLKELPQDAAARARALGYTVPQIVTLASLIEREAKADDERPLMAGVYFNRLKLGMPLEVDATIEYVFPEHKTEITRADLQINTPYNTYRNVGLPPTPIANAGRPSLWAAFHPVRSLFLYYVYKGNGHHAFAKTLAEHNANVARYLK